MRLSSADLMAAVTRAVLEETLIITNLSLPRKKRLQAKRRKEVLAQRFPFEYAWCEQFSVCK